MRRISIVALAGCFTLSTACWLLNEEAVKQHLLEPGFFQPTPEWDRERSADNIYT